MLVLETPTSCFPWATIKSPSGFQIQIDPFGDPLSPEEVVHNLAAVEGPVDIYTWYEGSQCLPKSGATFMRDSIFAPLFSRKKDAKLYLYSLRAWEFEKAVPNMAASTRIGDAINRINLAALECIYSSSFFTFCLDVPKDSPLFLFVQETLPKKEWLMKLSEKTGKTNPEESTSKKIRTVFDLFASQSSLFDYMRDVDVRSAYSSMQYIEGYYLIRESVSKKLNQGQKDIQIAFVLPNSEGKYYVDFPTDIEKMLQLDFGNALTGVKIKITFQFFKYKERDDSRPYIDKERGALKVNPEEIPSYFSYLNKPSEEKAASAFLRDIIHNLN